MRIYFLGLTSVFPCFPELYIFSGIVYIMPTIVLSRIWCLVIPNWKCLTIMFCLLLSSFDCSIQAGRIKQAWPECVQCWSLSQAECGQNFVAVLTIPPLLAIFVFFAGCSFAMLLLPIKLRLRREGSACFPNAFFLTWNYIPILTSTKTFAGDSLGEDLIRQCTFSLVILMIMMTKNIHISLVLSNNVPTL